MVSVKNDLDGVVKFLGWGRGFGIKKMVSSE